MSHAFPIFACAIRKRYVTMAQEELFVVDVPDLAHAYLGAFPQDTNPLFRQRTEHDCAACKQFLRTLGRCVTLSPTGVVQTVWDDGEQYSYPYNVVTEHLATRVRQAPIVQVFRSKERGYGTEKNYDTTTTLQWTHFAGKVEARHWTPQPAAVVGEKAAAFQVLQRGLTELTTDAVAMVLDLIDAQALYRGEQFQPLVADFALLQRGYADATQPVHFIWAHLDARGALIRNMAIGTLLQDLSAGVDLEGAVRSYEQKVAGDHYRRPTALITPRMIDAALGTLAALGLESAVHRRYARLSDVSVNNVLFVDTAVRGAMRDGLAELLLEKAVIPPATIAGARPLPVDSFLSELLPQIAHMEVLVEREHLSRFVSLTAPAQEDTGRLFPWNNDFAWSYDGDVADAITRRVKAAGGKIDAALRVSLAWSNYDDLDLHSQGPTGHVFFANKQEILDVDMNAGGGTTREPVENQAWTRAHLRDGMYRISVHNYRQREQADGGFTLEVATADRLEHFQYPSTLANNHTVQCLTLTVQKGQLQAIHVDDKTLSASTRTQQKWGLTTGTLVPVETVMLSPNHWDGQTIGNRHWFFLLQGCANPGSTRGFYNEFLHPALTPHRKVFEVLGGKLQCPPSSTQLSGLGFSSTQRATLTCLVRGKAVRGAYQILF